MTQEEKAKRYDEALEELRGLLEGIREEKCEILEEDITSIFPELQESEDERIRKELIFYLGDMPEDTELRNGVTNRDVLAWLEKQGEPTEINPSEFDLRLNKLLKQFETLPKKELASSLSFYLNVVQNGTYKEEKQGEQKPAWSEMDKTMVRLIKSDLELLKNRGDGEVGNAAYQGVINWLKSLKGRVGCEVNCTTTKEWKESLATADLENSLCDIQDGFSDTSYEYRTLGEAIEFIRCTESKPQWKPSDEQMDALQYVCRNFNPPLTDKLGLDSLKILELLYQDLKKL